MKDEGVSIKQRSLFAFPEIVESLNLCLKNEDSVDDVMCYLIEQLTFCDEYITSWFIDDSRFQEGRYIEEITRIEIDDRLYKSLSDTPISHLISKVKKDS